MFPDKLKKIRKERKMTQTVLAELCGISRNSIVNWETGKSTPKVGDIEKLSVVLGVSPQELVGYDRDNTHEEVLARENISPKGVAYWSGIVDEARRVAERGDVVEMQTIEPLLKLAYNVLLSGIMKLKGSKHNVTVPNVSAYNGDFSSYTGNSLTVGATV